MSTDTSVPPSTDGVERFDPQAEHEAAILRGIGTFDDLGEWAAARAAALDARECGCGSGLPPGSCHERPAVVLAPPAVEKSVHRTIRLHLAERSAETGQIIEVHVQRTLWVSIEEGGAKPVVIRGFGFNEARFASLEEVYGLFCHPICAAIRLDYNVCDLILQCIEELGFDRGYGHWR